MDLKETKVKVVGKEEVETKYSPKMNIKTEGGKYYCYKEKRDGTTSKAWEQLQKVSTGDTIVLAHTEDEKTFTNREGKQITYKDRRIAFVKSDEHNVPYVEKNATEGNSEPLNSTSIPTVELDGEIKPEDLPFS